MRTFNFEKLVRDKIKDHIIKQGNIPHWKTLSRSEFIAELKKKLLEEATEVESATGEDLIAELADAQAILDSLIKEVCADSKKFKQILKSKKKKNGQYKKKIYIQTVEARDDSEWMKYYLSDPKRFPEIK